jgi:hypothetical protein
VNSNDFKNQKLDDFEVEFEDELPSNGSDMLEEQSSCGGESDDIEVG